MKIRDKLFLVIIAIAAINLFFFVSISFLNVKEFLQAAISNDLDHVAEARKQEVEIFFEDIRSDLLTAQGYYNFKKNLPIVGDLSNNQSSKDYLEAKRELDGQMRVLQRVRKFRDIVLLNPSGQEVYSSASDLSEEHENIVNQYIPEIFENGKNDVYLSNPIADTDIGHHYLMLASAPVYGADENFIGEVVFEIDLDHLFDSIQNAVALGKTGEVVLGEKINDKEILVLNPLKHDREAALNRKITIGNPLGEGLQQAIQKVKGSGVITDYRGVESLASWYQIPSMGWELVVKIDSQEAFAPIGKLRNILAVLIFVQALVLLFFIFFIAKSISGPLSNLQKGMDIVAGEDLSYKLGTKSNDEVGQLSRKFDEMISKLKEAQFMYSELIETTPLCVKVFDSDGKLVFINKGGRDEHFIKEKEDISNWDWLDTVAEQHREMAKEKFNRALNGEAGIIEYQHVPKTSKHEWCSGALSPVKGEDGKVKAVLFYSSDITALRHIAMDLERKVSERTAQIESEKEKFSNLVQQLPVGVIMVRVSDENLIELNKKAEEFFEVESKLVIENGPFFKLLNIVKPDGTAYPKEELPMFSVIKKGEPAMKEDLCVKKSSGSIVNFREMAVPVKDVSGKVVYGIGVMEDITKEKRVEKMRRDFLSLASHQLRTPLSGTKWLVETLMAEKFGTLNPKQKQYLVELDHVNERMIRLVFDMLNALRFESGSLEIKPEEVTAVRVVSDIMDLMSPAATKAGVVIQSLLRESDHIIIETDISLIKTALETLFANAIEYSKAGQTIIIDAKEEQGEVVFSVKDFGIGIPEEEKARVFERFYRASNAKASKPDGTGLGLYISTMLAGRIGGKITFESKEQEGTTFYLRVPKIIDKGV